MLHAQCELRCADRRIGCSLCLRECRYGDMVPMRIGEAQQEYGKSGPECIDRDYRDLVQIFIKYRLKEEIPNSNYLHFLYLTDLMFQNSTRRIWMLNGPGKEGWLDILKQNLDDAIGRIKKAKGTLRAVFLSEKLPQTIVDLQSKYGNTVVQLATAKGSPGLGHFIVCDDRMLRLEQPHEELTPDMDSDKIVASVYLNNPFKTEAVANYFSSIWEALKPAT